MAEWPLLASINKLLFLQRARVKDEWLGHPEEM